MAGCSVLAQVDARFLRFFHDDAMSKPHTAPASTTHAGLSGRRCARFFPIVSECLHV